MITFVANGRTASYTSTDVITAGSVGIPVQFTLSEDFDGLSPIVVFEGSGTAVDVALVDNACVVPHEVVATAGGYLKIGIYARNGEGTIVIPTIWGNTCPILPGAAPSDVDPSQPTPDWTAQVQQIATDAYIKAEQAEGVANDAKSAAITAQDSAQASAEAAQSAREGAEAAQGFAETAESNARGFASDAAGSAGDAAAAKTAAETAEAHASGYVTDALNAKNAAVAAKEAAVTAQGKAEQAQRNAEGYATTAGNKAGEAAQSAQNALGYANTASSKAGEAANSATAAGNSATAANGDALKAEGYSVGEQNGTPVVSGSPYYENNAKYYAQKADMAAESGPITRTVTGNPVEITDGADDVGVKQLTVNIIPAQAGEGDPSPTNIRALSGWTGATLTINGEDIGITFPVEAGIVYAGTLDVLTGVLTVGYAIETLTSAKSVTVNGSNYYFALGSVPRKSGGVNAYSSHYKCVHPTSTSAFNDEDYAFTLSNSNFSSSNGRCFIRDVSQTTAADLKAYWDAQNLAGTPVQFVYPLATAQTYQLTPQVVKTLLGANSFSVDCGTLDLTYVADLQTYVDDEIAAATAVKDVQVNGTSIVQDGVANVVQADPSTIGIVCPGTTATQAITSGQYVIWGGKLYKATANIASGETLSTSTNLEAVPDGGLNELLEKIQRMNRWELINTVTVTEDSTEIKCITDSNGNAFRLRKMISIFSAGPSTTGARDYLKTSAYGYFPSISDPLALVSAPTIRYPSTPSSILARYIGEANFPAAVTGTIVTAAATGSTSAVEGMINPQDVRALTGFKVFQYSQTSSLIPANATLTIYGIRYYDD